MLGQNGSIMGEETDFRVKISLLFLTSETLYLVPVDVFENYDHLQSAADMKPGLWSF
jgi:hypothetical protein